MTLKTPYGRGSTQKARWTRQSSVSTQYAVLFSVRGESLGRGPKQPPRVLEECTLNQQDKHLNVISCRESESLSSSVWKIITS